MSTEQAFSCQNPSYLCNTNTSTTLQRYNFGKFLVSRTKFTFPCKSMQQDKATSGFTTSMFPGQFWSRSWRIFIRPLYGPQMNMLKDWICLQKLHKGSPSLKELPV
uniref:Trafficking protein particle complex subunit 6B n=1 Tax=Rhizophora mucronata TaxID=61149 RepID=A0A2P2M4Q5_RHIMU